MGQLKYHNGTSWVYLDLPDQNNSALLSGVALTGTIDGTNKVFTSPIPFATIGVYKNGLRMRVGATNDYTITSPTQITFNTAPAVTDPATTITADITSRSSVMISGSNSFVFHEVPAGLQNGTNTAFTTAQPYNGSTLQVFRNGIRENGVTETSPSAGTFTTDLAPLSTDHWAVAYQFANGVTGNADTVDNIHASTTPAPNVLLPLNSNSQFPLTAVETNVIQISRTSVWSMSTGNATVPFDTTVFTIGNKLTRSGSSVVIGEGVSYVRVSYSLMTESAGTAAYVYSLIQRNSSGVSQSIDGSTSGFKATSETKVIPVSAGDTISLLTSLGSGAATLRANPSSTLTVEVVT